MAFRIGLGALGLLLFVSLLVFLGQNWLPIGTLINVAAGLLSLAGIWFVVKIPWDLYFQARGVRKDQKESLTRKLNVEADHVKEATKLSRRLLFLSLFLHVAGAGLAFAASALTAEGVGQFWAAAFLLSMFFRPLGALYKHLRMRLMVLSRRAHFPREDAETMLQKVQQGLMQIARIDGQQKNLEKSVSQQYSDLDLKQREHEGALIKLDRQMAKDQLEHKKELDRVCVEFQHGIERLTTDQDLLTGIRAFLKVVRTG